MKPFDTYLTRAIRDEPPTADWTPYYINYSLFKEKLHSFDVRRRAYCKHYNKGSGTQERATDCAVSTRGRSSKTAPPTNTVHEYALFDEDQQDAWHRLSLLERTDMIETIDQELKKCFAFCQEQIEQLDHIVDKLCMATAITTSDYSSSIPASESSTNATTETTQSSTSIAEEWLELVHFLVTNMITLRQVMVRYEAFARVHQNAKVLTEWDLRQSSTTLQHEPLRSLESLLHIQTCLEDYFTKQVSATSAPEQQNQAMLNQQQWHDMQEAHDDFMAILQNASFVSSMQSTTIRNGATALISSTSHARSNLMLRILREYFLLGAGQMGLSLEPSFLLTKRHLKHECKALAKWRKGKKNDRTTADEENGGPSAPLPPTTTTTCITSEMDPKNVWPLLLNLLSCFLFMMNNYIIEPSSAYYANALGSSDAMSGMMIGAAPWFALTSAVGYSIWTNHSYKNPIMFSSVLMVIGNLLYGNAYSYNSMSYCLLGRCICGLGAPRVINRRYVADATPFTLRTASSAAFALATALGAALGPGMAIVLDIMPPFDFSLPLLGPQYWNSMTGPGYFMACAWGVYTLLIVFTFSEPNRSGLDELREREKRDQYALASQDDVSLSSCQKTVPFTASKSMTLEDGGGDEGSTSSDSGESDKDMSCCSENSKDELKDADDVPPSSPLYCVKHMTRAAAICMIVIFMKRVALEAIVGSTSIITKNRFHWTIRNVGTLHLVNGIIVIPCSILAGWMSQFYEDRYLAIWLLCITISGMMLMVDVTDIFDPDSSDAYNAGESLSVGPGRYIAGSLIAFSGIEACESFVASLMSKVVPSALAAGTFNSGLLTTLVGTSGRAAGDLFITLMGLIDIRNLLNLLIIPGIVMMVISAVLIRSNYGILSV